MIKNSLLTLITVFALGACAHSHKGHSHHGEACSSCKKEASEKCGNSAEKEKGSCDSCKKAEGN